MTLQTEATTAWDAELAAADAAQADADAAFRALATDALRAMLTRFDGTQLTITDAGLSAVLTDLPNGLVVWTATDMSLAAQYRGDVWVILLVEGSGTEWTVLSQPLTTLADLGQTLADRAAVA